jgi:hypothetical protein
MKWWNWLVLELLIIFGVIAWIYLFPGEIEEDFSKGMIGFVLLYCVEQRRKGMNENYTIEQNAGENQIESGVVSGSSSVEKQYRPFNDCNELIEHYQKKYKSAVGCDIYFPSLYKPCIWIRDKTEDAKGDIELITGFTEHGNVLLNGTSYPLQILFQMYEFLDGTPVGVEV